MLQNLNSYLQKLSKTPILRWWGWRGSGWCQQAWQIHFRYRCWWWWWWRHESKSKRHRWRWRWNGHRISARRRWWNTTPTTTCWWTPSSSIRHIWWSWSGCIEKVNTFSWSRNTAATQRWLYATFWGIALHTWNNLSGNCCCITFILQTKSQSS